ncbi:MAG: BNR-repeat neuraminidase N-terminal domain-containing protein, partial [Bacteroidota bacterium]|nr:BNR-repeat neuraminidase N-terminal domain-containing protein [Bacteroidota bacterium]
TRDAVAPCIGADEFTFSAMSYDWSTCSHTYSTPARSGAEKQEILRIAVDVNGLTSPLTATGFTFTTAGTTATSDITAARLYYTGLDAEFSTDNPVGSVSAPAATFTIAGSQALQGPGTTYFWLAYDVASAAAEGNQLDAGLTGITIDGNTYTPLLSEPPGSRSIVNPMIGAYTIDAAGSGNRNYTDFTSAIADLVVRSVDGAVSFSVAADTYSEQLVIPPIPGASAVNTITFDGGAGNASTRVLRYDVNTNYGSVVKLDGADHVTFRDITIQSVGSNYGYCMHFTNGADYNTVIDCVLDLPVNTTQAQHIGICGSGERYSDNGDWGNHNLIQGNLIRNAYYGVNWRGESFETLTTNFDNRFVDNTIEDFYYYGIYQNYSSALVLDGNTLKQRTSGTYYATGGYGIYLSFANEGPLIARNTVLCNHSPFRLYNLNYAMTASATRARVCNNMCVGTGSGPMYGLYVAQADQTDIVFNSVHLNESPYYLYGMYLSFSTNTSGNVRVMNNTVAHSGIGSIRFVHVPVSSPLTVFDNNMYWRHTPGIESWYWNGVEYPSLAALQTAITGQHQHSLMGDPEFVSDTDLHSASVAGYRAGVSVASVTDDIDGESRHAPPCIGADEYVFCDIVCPEDIVAANDPGVCGAAVSFTPTITQGCGTVTSTPPSGSFFPVGSTTVTCVTDAGPQCSFTVTVRDAEAPVITPSLPISLWPVDHGYETITLSQMIAALTDNCDVLLVTDVRIVAATSDEAETGGGSGNTLDDIVIANDCRSVDLRREREGTGDGRVYTIHLAVTDAANNAGSAVFKVHVPHNVSSAAVEGSVQYSVSGPCGAPKQRSGDLMPDGFALEQNYPNPFNPSTTIRFTIPRDADVTLRVYDMFGRCVAVLAEGWYTAGSYHMQFEGSRLPSGNYVCRLEAGGQLLHRSMLLAK